MRNQFLASVALAAIILPGAAFAQSTGTIDAEEEIVVTASRTQDGINGAIAPDSPKARTVLTQELIGRRAAGQSILNTINVVPGVNFTNSDPYGSAGGNIRIRGFDGARISLTFDGLPLNDTGNYAIFSNQQLDPEIIEQVNVNQGTTDIDSPTASAAGGTVNYRTSVPTEEPGAMLQGSVGDFDYTRVFAKLETGRLTSFGTKIFVAGSLTRYDKFKGPGEISKKQFNARLYQPIGDSGDFISVAGHYNQNRNNFYRNLTLAQARTDFADNGNFDYDNNAFCARATPNAATPQNENTGNGSVPQTSTAIPGPVDTSCTNYFGLRINPSNTGNIRINSKFTLAEGLTLTVDPSFQYVLANGGGFSTIAENSPIVRGANLTAIDSGVDYNGDGNVGNFGSFVSGVFVPAAPNAGRTNFVPDTTAFYTPNTTNTRRYGLTASLRWDFMEDQYVRVAYTFDRGRHRQTGEWGYLNAVGRPENVFGGRNGRPVLAADGALLRQRDRLSIALLNQISGEYRGRFFDDALTINLGLRAPFFKRELENFCYTQTTGSGFATCTTQPVTALTIVPPTQVAPFPAGSLYAPFKAEYKFDKLLPSAGFIFKVTPQASIFGNFSQGFSAPRTDNLYRAPRVTVSPETTDNFDLGVRYSSRMIQAQINGYYNKFSNRIVTSFDQDQGISVDRNVGDVEIKGVEASVDVQPFPWLYFRGFGSYIDSEVKGNTQLSATVTALTAGKRLAETPEWQYGYLAQVTYGPASVGAVYKHVNSRFATDANDIKVPGYNTLDLDARLDLKDFGLANTYLQLNLTNVFDEKYLGNISTQIVGPTANGTNVTGLAVGASIPGGGNPTFGVGAPRTFQATVRVGF